MTYDCVSTCIKLISLYYFYLVCRRVGGCGNPCDLGRPGKGKPINGIDAMPLLRGRHGFFLLPWSVGQVCRTICRKYTAKRLTMYTTPPNHIWEQVHSETICSFDELKLMIPLQFDVKPVWVSDLRSRNHLIFIIGQRKQADWRCNLGLFTAIVFDRPGEIHGDVPLCFPNCCSRNRPHPWYVCMCSKLAFLVFASRQVLAHVCALVPFYACWCLRVFVLKAY